MITDDEYLERIVAGIQAATTSGAEVTWNEIIDERQFDVCVFRLAKMTPISGISASKNDPLSLRL